MLAVQGPTGFFQSPRMPALGRRPWKTEVTFTDVTASCGQNDSDPCQRRHSHPALAAECTSATGARSTPRSAVSFSRAQGPSASSWIQGTASRSPSRTRARASMPSIPEHAAPAYCTDRGPRTRQDCNREPAKLRRQRPPADTLDLWPLANAAGHAERRRALDTEAAAPEEAEAEAEADQQARRSTSTSSTESSRHDRCSSVPCSCCWEPRPGPEEEARPGPAAGACCQGSPRALPRAAQRGPPRPSAAGRPRGARAAGAPACLRGAGI
ncbi:unnamed protein product, partial [Prorocentrum cordatum]